MRQTLIELVWLTVSSSETNLDRVGLVDSEQ